ncbi:MAG TPA: hypothetical protein ACFYD3_02075 [Candidatus Hypogeohydataceae bacterium YC41]
MRPTNQSYRLATKYPIKKSGVKADEAITGRHPIPDEELTEEYKMMSSYCLPEDEPVRAMNIPGPNKIPVTVTYKKFS